MSDVLLCPCSLPCATGDSKHHFAQHSVVSRKSSLGNALLGCGEARKRLPNPLYRRASGRPPGCHCGFSPSASKRTAFALASITRAMCSTFTTDGSSFGV